MILSAVNHSDIILLRRAVDNVKMLDSWRIRTARRQAAAVSEGLASVASASMGRLAPEARWWLRRSDSNRGELLLRGLGDALWEQRRYIELDEFLLPHAPHETRDVGPGGAFARPTKELVLFDTM